ncbi:alpha/beta hydrolase [Glutamicibacter sp. PS]|uniref:alpha/beta fold hydrolase n=1 Tax=Glutamicibacter sp. PS TaxID=3075634 RepID=UPI00283DC8A5|nr:alpha/beta hydrolase [Glutamicibacter sp. PS]MDR4533086.1 alpha/beta hydrolase [Glutamicibacter sp. PS]
MAETLRRDSARTFCLTRDEVSLCLTDLGGSGAPVLLLHGLAGSSRELRATAHELSGTYRVLLMDQRGHGRSTRRPSDLSRDAFVADVEYVLENVLMGEPCALIGQSMGAHTAFLTAAKRPDLVRQLIMLEGHPAGNENPQAAANLGRFFASWPVPFGDEVAARHFLGDHALATAWIADMERASQGLVPRFDADIMQETIAGVHQPRWTEWERLQVPTLAVFARRSLFNSVAREELNRRRPATEVIELAGGTHDAHLDAFDEWMHALRAWVQ